MWSIHMCSLRRLLSLRVHVTEELSLRALLDAAVESLRVDVVGDGNNLYDLVILDLCLLLF
jgi:hypothetical protein